MSFTSGGPLLAFAAFALQVSPDTTGKFTLFQANKTMALWLLVLFALAVVVGLVSLFFRSSRKFVGTIMAFLTLIYVGLTALAVVSGLSPWPFPVFAVILAILSIVLFVFRHRPV